MNVSLYLTTEKLLLTKLTLFDIQIQVSIIWGTVSTGFREEFMFLIEYSLKRQKITFED